MPLELTLVSSGQREVSRDTKPLEDGSANGIQMASEWLANIITTTSSLGYCLRVPIEAVILAPSALSMPGKVIAILRPLDYLYKP
jgi:hypothetical protein